MQKLIPYPLSVSLVFMDSFSLFFADVFVEQPHDLMALFPMCPNTIFV